MPFAALGAVLGTTAAMAGVIAVGTVAAIGGTVAQSVMQAKTAKKQSRAMEAQAAAQRQSQAIEQKRANVLTQKDRYAQIREGRIKRAQILSSTANAGVRASGTSGAVGATGGIRSQTSENIGTLGQMQGFGERLSQLNQQSMTAQSDYMRAGAKGAMWQSIFGGISQVGQAGLSFAGGASGAGKTLGGGGPIAPAVPKGSIFGTPSARTPLF